MRNFESREKPGPESPVKQSTNEEIKVIRMLFISHNLSFLNASEKFSTQVIRLYNSLQVKQHFSNCSMLDSFLLGATDF